MEPVLTLESLSVFYQGQCALEQINLSIPAQQIIAIIGPSGSGKSTLLRSCNRLNDLIPGMHVQGKVLFQGQNIYAPTVDPVKVRRRIGMVFQRPNPFPKSIYENIAFGARINGFQGKMDDLVEKSLRQAALWDEVKDKLRKNSTLLSGGQQQRLCIARAIALQPTVVLMDEPCSALDPMATEKIEQLLQVLKPFFTIVIVTHNLQQARRISDHTAFINVEPTDRGTQAGKLVEYAPTPVLFNHPQQASTARYVEGRFG